jgi:heterodisulfide reductase subunit C
MLQAILGFQDVLIQSDSVIWNCTNCYTCSERCPQDVRPVDVIIALKNMCAKENKAPDVLGKISNAVLETGITTKMTSLAERRRLEFDLSVPTGYPVEELKKILESD